MYINTCIYLFIQCYSFMIYLFKYLFMYLIIIYVCVLHIHIVLRIVACMSRKPGRLVAIGRQTGHAPRDDAAARCASTNAHAHTPPRVRVCADGRGGD